MDPHTSGDSMAIIKKRKKKISKTNPGPQWVVVSGMLHMRIKDAAAHLGVTIPYLRRLCKENGYSTWPGKSVRYMNSTGNLMMEVGAPEGSPMAGLAGPSQPTKVMETKKKEKVKELVTLDLIDKVGSSSTSSKRN